MEVTVTGRLVAPARALTELATVRAVLVLDNVTVTPAEETGWENVAVQVVLAFGARLAASHWSDVTVRVGTSAIEAVFEEVPELAVIVAV